MMDAVPDIGAITGSSGVAQPYNVIVGILLVGCGIIIVWLALRQRKAERKVK